MQHPSNTPWQLYHTLEAFLVSDIPLYHLREEKQSCPSFSSQQFRTWIYIRSGSTHQGSPTTCSSIADP